jgi:peptide/nickel transport system substrate-binding protein
VKKVVYLSLLVLLIAAFLLTGCGATTTTTAPPATTSRTTTTQAGPQYGGTLRMIEYAMAPGPFGLPDEGAGPVSSLQQFVMEPLMRERLDGTFEPMLATSWTIAGDKTSMTFTLRQGVKFHDGTVFDANVVKWNFDRVIAAKRAASWASVDVVDTNTIRVNFKYWQNVVPVSVASVMLASPAAFDKNGIEWMRWNMVGTGPFKQVAFQKDVSAKFVKNPDYWQKGKPYLDAIEDTVVADPMTEVAAMKAGSADVLWGGGADFKMDDLKKAGFDIYTLDAGVYTLVPDSGNADSPWSNPLVRQAAEYAIDKAAIAKAQGFGMMDAAYQVIHPGIPSFNPDITGRKYDVAKAKQLLKDAGYETGFKTTVVTYAMDAIMKDIATAVVGYLNEVGIEANLSLLEGADYLSKYTNGKWNNALVLDAVARFAGDYMRSLDYYITPPDSGSIVRFASCARSDAYNKAFTAAISAAEYDPKLVQALSKQVYDDAMVIPVNTNVLAYAAATNVHDADFLKLGSSYGRWFPEKTWMSAK